MANNLYQKTIKLIWYLMLFILPVTSMPLVAKILKSDTVAAPSILFLFILTLFWLLPYLHNSGTLSKLNLPLIIFVISAFVSTLCAIFIEIPTFKTFSFFLNNLQSLITLAIGFCFFIVASTLPHNDKVLRNSLRVINWSGLIMLVWAGIQIFSWAAYHKYFEWMFNFQGLFSSRVLYHNRATGFALEPSWFSHQLNMLYLPLWLAASIRRYSSHTMRFFGFSFENCLLIAGITGLFFTFSRGGFLAFLSMLTLISIFINIRVIKKIRSAWMKKVNARQNRLQSVSKLITAILAFLLIIAYLSLILLGAYVLSRIDPRMENLFEFKTDKENPLLTYFNNLQFGERVVYWLSGWEIFGDHPILGVGLGNAGFFFPSKITPYGWTLIEIRRLMYEYDVLLNIKSLWVRILAETGLVGFSIFLSWLILLLSAFVRVLRDEKGINAALGLAGIFVIVALPAEGFSIDSFALPYLWISMGLAVSATRLSTESAYLSSLGNE